METKASLNMQAGAKQPLRLPDGMPLVVPASIAWNLVILLGSVALSLSIFQLEDFNNLGRPVQYFVALVALIPALVALFSSWGLYRKRSSGRYSALALHFGGVVGGSVALLFIWGVFNGFEAFVDNLMVNGYLTLGFALAYALYWVAGKLGDDRWKDILTKAALGLAGLTLIAVLWTANILQAANAVISTYGQLPAWAATAALLISAGLGWRMLHMGGYFGELPEHRNAWQGWLMLSPNLIGFMFFFAGPLLLSFYLSFTDSALGKTPSFIGFQNYSEALGLEVQSQQPSATYLQDAMSFGYTAMGAIDLGGQRLVLGAKNPLFWISLRNTLLFCLLLLPLAIIPALALSLILNSKLPGMKFYRAVYFLPSVAAVVGMALIWRWLYDPTIGFFNYTITQLVNFLNTTFGVSLQDPAIQWLTDSGVVLISVVLLAAWQIVGYNTVLYLAGLQGIPGQLYEAAMIDGANRWEQFRFVTFPMLRPTTFFVLITTLVTSLQVFNEPYTLFPAQPIPENASTSVYYLYRQGFFNAKFGYASSIAWILFAVIFLLTLTQFRLQRSNPYE